MAGDHDREELRCPAQVHLTVDHRRFVRRRCTNPRCPDAQRAKSLGLHAIHVWDVEGRIEPWTDYIALPKGGKQNTR